LEQKDHSIYLVYNHVNRRKKKGSYRLGFKDSEYDVFYNKFYGSLIFRGRKSYAFRMFDNILFNFKNQLKVDPYIELRKAIENLIPILGLTKKRIGKVYHSVPKMAVGNRRFVIMLNWIIKKQKGKSNVLGFKIDDVSRHLIDAVSNRGVLINLKKQHLAVALAGKHHLYTNRRFSKFRFRRRRKRINKNIKLRRKKKKTYSS